jgi:hypothetical protein
MIELLHHAIGHRLRAEIRILIRITSLVARVWRCRFVQQQTGEIKGFV